jgi:hypothetical protein
MKKRPPMTASERATKAILDRTLARHGYRAYPQQPLAAVLEKEPGDRLSSREFEYFTRARLDFAIEKNNVFTLAVEFDGLDHFWNPVVRERDKLKNRLCRLANLPLIRIGWDTIQTRERTSILEFILNRHLAWLRRGRRQRPSWIGWGEPFPGTKAVTERLWRKFNIASLHLWKRQKMTAAFLADYTAESDSPHPDSEELRRLHGLVTLSTGKAVPVARLRTTVIYRALLMLDDISDCPTDPLEAAIYRAERMALPDLEGVNPGDIAVNISEYLTYRALEIWAGRNLRGRRRV